MAADASVFEAYPSTNYGRWVSLRAKEAPGRSVASYLRFRVDTESVERAVLRLFARRGSADGPALFETDKEWRERQITWGSRPDVRGRALADAARIPARSWVDFDVTDVIKGPGTYSFLLEGTSADAVSFKSREAAKRRPKLILDVEMDGAMEPSPSRSPSPTGTTTPESSPSPSPSQTSSPSSVSGEVLIAAAGDIACDPEDKGFNGGEGAADRCHMEATSDLLIEGDYDAVLTLGDNQYNSGTLSEFMASYDPTWGRVKDITFPSPGNHEYGMQQGRGYFDYFGDVAGDRDEGYYSFDLGDWHFLSINSNCDAIGGCEEGSPQEDWVEDDLADSDAECTIAYWHHPRFSSGHDGNATFMSDIYEELYDAGVELLLAGHSHDYERFHPLDPSGNRDDANGIREFVVGTGGAFFTGFSTIQPHSVVRQNETFGVLELELDDDAYEWRFVPEEGESFEDSGSASCH